MFHQNYVTESGCLPKLAGIFKRQCGTEFRVLFADETEYCKYLHTSAYIRSAQKSNGIPDAQNFYIIYDTVPVLKLDNVNDLWLVIEYYQRINLLKQLVI